MAIPISLGLYTVYDDLCRDMPDTLRRVAALGYDGVEFYGEFAWPAEDVRRALDDAGLTLTGWHTEWRLLQPDTLYVTMAYLRAVGCPVAIVPCLGGQWHVAHGPGEECRAVWQGYIARMNELVGLLAPHGIALGYHNHEHEFQLRYDGETVFDLLYGQLNGAVVMELDTGNAIEGGGDPAAVLRQYHGRPTLLHCKPWSVETGFDVRLGEPGDRNDWPAILAACGPACRALVVENEAKGDGFANAAACLAGLRQYR